MLHMKAGDFGYLDNRELTCFYCYEPVTYPRIEWAGGGTDIAMHPECTSDLCIRLLRDVHEYQCKKESTSCQT